MWRCSRRSRGACPRATTARGSSSPRSWTEGLVARGVDVTRFGEGVAADLEARATWCDLCRLIRQPSPHRSRRLAAASRSPLTDSNRRTPPYHRALRREARASGFATTKAPHAERIWRRGVTARGRPWSPSCFLGVPSGRRAVVVPMRVPTRVAPGAPHYVAPSERAAVLSHCRLSQRRARGGADGARTAPRGR
jgi:hypothetical protein